MHCKLLQDVVRQGIRLEYAQEIGERIWGIQMNEAEVRKSVNKKISEVLEEVYDALYYASAPVDQDIRFKVLRDNIEEINKRITGDNNG